MTRTIAAALDWVKSHPRRPDGASWDGWCEALVADSGGFTNSFETAALELARASKLYKPSQVPAGKAPDGWLYHWAYSEGGTDYGHVAFAVPGGLALMASSYITRRIGVATGTIAAADYAHVSGHEYLGASPDHGGQYLAGVPHTLPHPSASPKPVQQHVTVVRGDTLWGIAVKHGLTLSRIELLNPQIHDFDLIHPGDKIRVR